MSNITLEDELRRLDAAVVASRKENPYRTCPYCMNLAGQCDRSESEHCPNRLTLRESGVTP